MLREAFLTERFLSGSRYCRGVWVIDFLRSAHTPGLLYVTVHLATAHRWQWDCCTVNTLTCPGRKVSRRITDWCIPFTGAPAILHAGHRVSWPTCFFCLTRQNVDSKLRARCHHQGDPHHLFLIIQICGSPSPGFQLCWSLRRSVSICLYLVCVCVPASSTWQRWGGRRFKQPRLPLNPP